MAQNIVRRIFGNRKLPENMSDDEYEKYMQEWFPKWITEFEQGGFLDATKIPAIKNEEELLRKLKEHENDLMVIKYWKHGCIPCLSFAEMYKEAQQRCLAEKRRIVWYSVDTRSGDSAEMVDYQTIQGTPTIQTFHRRRQVGDEIRAVNIDDLMKELTQRLPSQ